MPTYINNVRPLPLPRYMGAEPDPVPAEPFPSEPGDMPAQQPPEPQQGDPGAEPPPAGIEQVPDKSNDPLAQVIERVVAQSQADMRSITRLTEALINQLSACNCTVRMARASIERLTADEVKPMALLADLHQEAAALVEALAQYRTGASALN